jgi:hypothetical protein
MLALFACVSWFGNADDERCVVYDGFKGREETVGVMKSDETSTYVRYWIYTSTAAW